MLELWINGRKDGLAPGRNGGKLATV